MRPRSVVLAVACVVLELAPGLLLGSLVSLAPWPAAVPTSIGLRLPSTGSLPTLGIATTLVVVTGLLVLLRSHRAAALAPTWASGQLVEPALHWTSAGFTKSLRLVLEGVLRPERTIAVDTSGGTVQEVSYSGRVPQLLEEQILEPAVRLALGGAAQARRLQSGRLGTYAAYLIALVLVLLVAAKIGLIG